MSVPKMYSVRNISALVSGQFGITFLSAYLIKSTVLGCPIICCKERAHTASEY